MSVTIPTVYVYNVKARTIETKSVDNVKDKWIGNYNTNFENRLSIYIKGELKL